MKAATYAKEVIQIVNARRMDGQRAAEEEGGALGGLGTNSCLGQRSCGNRRMPQVRAECCEASEKLKSWKIRF